MTPDLVNHPPHYKSHPSGVEVIEITEHMNFCLGNVVKYILRADHKGAALQDLEKAAWYLAREIARRKGSTQEEEVSAEDFFEATPKTATSADFLGCL